VVDVDITLGALTDLNEAYRTVLTADSASPQQALFTKAASTQQVRFAGGSGVNGSVIGVAIGLGVVVLPGVGFYLVRRRRRAS
jgi:hypothetical protein